MMSLRIIRALRPRTPPPSSERRRSGGKCETDCIIGDKVELVDFFEFGLVGNWSMEYEYGV